MNLQEDLFHPSLQCFLYRCLFNDAVAFCSAKDDYVE
jgi:hypothetical protein